MRRALVCSLLTAAFLLTGCPKRDAVKDGAGTEAGEEGSGAQSGAANREGLEEGSAIGDRDSQPLGGALAERIVYFEYDRADIRAEFNGLISAHARHLASNPNMRVRLEGHSDERGSREYNIGLGERRAQTVRRALMLQGVGDNQIATVSYGEERPAVSGSDESSWGKNRRVEIVYAN